MNALDRFQQEWQRLFGAPQDLSPGHTRALVMELTRPADWAAVARLAQGVQTELGLPAPALAVNGVDGFQLWFAAQQPVALAQAEALLQALWAHFWPQADARRVRCWPAAADGVHGGDEALAPPAVPLEAAPGQWSAFVAPDLGAVFADTPWLDTPPQPQNQAELLGRVQGLAPDDLQAALAQLLPSGNPAQHQRPTRHPPQPAHPVASGAGAPSGAFTHSASPGSKASGTASGTAPTQPHSPAAQAQDFLLQVMHDPSAPLRWRIAAAQALLPLGR